MFYGFCVFLLAESLPDIYLRLTVRNLATRHHGDKVHHRRGHGKPEHDAPRETITVASIQENVMFILALATSSLP